MGALAVLDAQVRQIDHFLLVRVELELEGHLLRVAHIFGRATGIFVLCDSANSVIYEEAARQDPVLLVFLLIRVSTCTSCVLDEKRDVDQVVIVVPQVELEEVVLACWTLQLIRRNQVLQVDVAPDELRDADAEDRFLLFAVLLADVDLIEEVLKADEITLERVLGKDEAQLADDTDVEVLVVEARPELDLFGLLNHRPCVRALIEQPRHGAVLEACIFVVRLHAAIQLADRVLVQPAHGRILIVELQDAQVGQELALLHVLELGAADGRINVVVLQGAALEGERRQCPTAA